MSPELNADYWSGRYRQDDAAWDLGAASRPLQEYFDTLKDPHISVLIPGAGNCYEGEYLLGKGFTGLTELDYAPEAISGFKKRVRAHEKANLLCEDFFEHQGQYDLIIEQTFFCALDPKLRSAYCKKMQQLLKPGGKLVGLLFTSVPNPEGPPFAASYEEYQKLFAAHFTIEKLEPCYNSIKPREGRELFFVLKMK